MSWLAFYVSRPQRSALAKRTFLDSFLNTLAVLIPETSLEPSSLCNLMGLFFSPRPFVSATRCYHVQHEADKFKVLFLGRDEFSCAVLAKLFSANDIWSEIHVGTYPDEHKGRRRWNVVPSPLRLQAEEYGIPVDLIPSAKSDFKHWKPYIPFLPTEPSSKPTSLPLSNILITASFGRIISSSLLDKFHPDRRLNIHPSLLPQYRGSAPIQHAIMNGDTQTGVSVVSMLKWKEGLDTGNVWGSKEAYIPDNASFQSLRDDLADQSAQLLVHILRDMKSGKAISKPQTELGIPGPWLTAPMITVNDSFVNFETMDATTILRKQRAISHQRPITAFLQSQRPVQLHKPFVYSGDDIHNIEPGQAYYHPTHSVLFIGCANNTILAVPKLKSQNKALVAALDWWNGMKSLGFVDWELKLITFTPPPPPSETITSESD